MSWCGWILDVIEFFLGSVFFQTTLCSSLDSALSQFIGDNMNVMLEDMKLTQVEMGLTTPYETVTTSSSSSSSSSRRY